MFMAKLRLFLHSRNTENHTSRLFFILPRTDRAPICYNCKRRHFAGVIKKPNYKSSITFSAPFRHPEGALCLQTDEQ